MATEAISHEVKISAGEVKISAGEVELSGHLEVPAGAAGIVVFAHGSGSSRFSPRNQQVAARLHDAGLATLLFDLLTPDEEIRDRLSRAYRFDIELLAGRLVHVSDWLSKYESTANLRLGYFGASTGAAAALIAAARRPDKAAAVVSRGGRPDLAMAALGEVKAPTLLIVGGLDEQVIVLNRQAQAALGDTCQMDIIPGASHLFEEGNTLDQAADAARDWFLRHLASRS